MSKTAKMLIYCYTIACLASTPATGAIVNGIQTETNNIVIANQDQVNSKARITEYVDQDSVTIEEVAEETLMPHGQVIEDGSRLRFEPNYDSGTKRLLYKGMTFDIVSKHNEFLEISIDGQSGFVHSSLIEQYEEEPPYELYVEPIVAEVQASQEVSVGQVDGVPHFNPYNLRELSNLSENQIYKMLEGSALQTLSRAYYYYEKEYNVNAIFLMALNSEESGHGRSALAISHNNLGGVKNGNQGWAYFSDWGECLRYIANLIDTHYLSEDGIYYNGPSIWGVNTKYCEGIQWSENLIAIANNLIGKLQ